VPRRARRSGPAPGAAALDQALRIAFAPIAFQAARCLRDSGILAACDGGAGADEDALAASSGLPRYGTRVLVEAGLGIGLLAREGDRFRLTDVGWQLLHDPMAIANMDFAHHVCYRGMFLLEESVRSGKPEGLRTLGPYDTVYRALADLPPDVQRSWFAFEHLYSDELFALAMPHVTTRAPRALLDIGGNTGKFASRFAAAHPAARVGIADLPEVLGIARDTLRREGFEDRITLHPVDARAPDLELPPGYDAVWMSQFLDCFSEREVVAILRACRRALPASGRVFILEPFWDLQPSASAAYCLQMLTLYFTAIANGNSKIYGADAFLPLVREAGLKVLERIDGVGAYHSLLVCGVD
jgi:ubiquinone/menaquinone biosynthesis C-methylase UbiE